MIAGATKAVGVGTAVFEGVRQIGGLLGIGGGSDVNIARSFARRHKLACDIPQGSVPQARALIAKRIDPCTGRPFPTGIDTAVNVPVVTTQPTVNIPTAQPGGAPIIQAGMPMSLQTAIGGLGGAIARSAPGVIRTVTGKISSIVMPSGKRFSRRDAAAFLRRIGDVATGAALMGISQQDAAEILLTAGRRRRRGITAAQVRNARRTACMVSRLARDLNVKPAPARRRTCR